MAHKSLLLAALLASFASTIGAATSPGVLEIDLIFPRNDTYAPVDNFPVVFAIQNPDLVPSLAVLVFWELLSVRQKGGQDPLPGELQDNIDLQDFNGSAAHNPYMLTDRIQTLSGIEDTWYFQWGVDGYNCSSDPESKDPIENTPILNTVVFTTKNGAPKPDLVAATSHDTCALTQNAAFNVTGFVNTPPGWKGLHDAPSCAVLGSSQTTTNPCAVMIDSSAASSISVAVTQSTQTPTASALPQSDAGKCARGFQSLTLAAWAALVAVLLF